MTTLNMRTTTTITTMTRNPCHQDQPSKTSITIYESQTPLYPIKLKMYSPTFREPPLPSGPTRRPGQPTSAPSRRPNAPPVHPALNQVKLKHKVTIRDTNCTCQESWPKTITSFLPVPCPATANNAASAKKPAEANATTREADQPGSTAGKGACQGKIRIAIL